MCCWNSLSNSFESRWLMIVDAASRWADEGLVSYLLILSMLTTLTYNWLVNRKHGNLPIFRFLSFFALTLSLFLSFLTLSLPFCVPLCMCVCVSVYLYGGNGPDLTERVGWYRTTFGRTTWYNTGGWIHREKGADWALYPPIWYIPTLISKRKDNACTQPPPPPIFSPCLSSPPY